MTDFVRARKMMVENQLRTSNITDRRVLAVMAQVPRELFVPEGRRDLAYIDEAHRLPAQGSSRYLSAPAPFGRMLQLAGINTSDKVLDLGCGTGYSAAVLAGLVETVVAVESDADLAAAAQSNLAALGITNATVLVGPVELGAAKAGPFDVIVLEGAVDAVPQALLDQLREDGRLVALLRQGATAVANLYVRSGSDVAARAEFNTSLPPLLPENRSPDFVF
jgi:protein-L-isoaspartate(D-aspartate) O-methyltransferase